VDREKWEIRMLPSALIYLLAKHWRGNISPTENEPPIRDING
jgi:hypothetical protein